MNISKVLILFVLISAGCFLVKIYPRKMNKYKFTQDTQDTYTLYIYIYFKHKFDQFSSLSEMIFYPIISVPVQDFKNLAFHLVF